MEEREESRERVCNFLVLICTIVCANLCLKIRLEVLKSSGVLELGFSGRRRSAAVGGSWRLVAARGGRERRVCDRRAANGGGVRRRAVDGGRRWQTGPNCGSGSIAPGTLNPCRGTKNRRI